MRCPLCHLINPDSAVRCDCGYEFANRGMNDVPVKVPIQKTSVLLLLLLNTVTCGIYYPIWFLRKRNELNNLNSGEKLNSSVFIVAIVLFSTNLLLAIMTGFLEGIGESIQHRDLFVVAKTLDRFSRFLHLVAAIALLMQCFRVRRILADHFKGISFSAVGTFFFQIFYLQYKINRLQIDSRILR
jgi:hypothetical protein